MNLDGLLTCLSDYTSSYWCYYTLNGCVTIIPFYEEAWKDEIY